MKVHFYIKELQKLTKKNSHCKTVLFSKLFSKWIKITARQICVKKIHLLFQHIDHFQCNYRYHGQDTVFWIIRGLSIFSTIEYNMSPIRLLGLFGLSFTTATQWAITDELAFIPKCVRTHAITILILREGNGSPSWYPQRIILIGNLEDIATSTDFTRTWYH